MTEKNANRKEEEECEYTVTFAGNSAREEENAAIEREIWRRIWMENTEDKNEEEKGK